MVTGAYGVDMPGAKALWSHPAVVREYGKPLLATIRQSNLTGRYPKLVPQYDKFWNVISTDLQPFWQDQATVQDGDIKSLRRRHQPGATGLGAAAFRRAASAATG